VHVDVEKTVLVGRARLDRQWQSELDRALQQSHAARRDAGQRSLGKPRDRLSFPEPHGNGLWSQAIYYRLLDCGLRIPPSAGSAFRRPSQSRGLQKRVYVCVRQGTQVRCLVGEPASGKVVVTNGPLIREPRMNGKLPGHVFQAETGQSVYLEATTQPVGAGESRLFGNRQGRSCGPQVRLAGLGRIGGRLPPVQFDQSGWILVRARNRPIPRRTARIDGPVVVEIGANGGSAGKPVQFFLDWVYERARPPRTARWRQTRRRTPVPSRRTRLLAELVLNQANAD